jgi:hypothetical protein
MGRGSGWTDSEDVCLGKAWLWATEDAINGTFQDAQSFWNKVTVFLGQGDAGLSIARGCEGIAALFCIDQESVEPNPATRGPQTDYDKGRH